MIRKIHGMIFAIVDDERRDPQVNGSNPTDCDDGLRSRERAFLGATLGATGANNLQGIRTRMNSGQGRVRGHGLI